MDLHPKMLYKAGGSEELHGGKFATLIVADADAEAAAVADGWAPTTTEALAAEAEAKDRAERQAAGKAPTRAELEEQAAKLGIPFGPKVSDRKLAALVAEAAGRVD